MKLHHTNHNTKMPAVGTKVDVHVGMPMSRRTIEGEIVRVTATQVIVRYEPTARRFRVIEERFAKKDGRRVGDGKFMDGPAISLRGEA